MIEPAHFSLDESVASYEEGRRVPLRVPLPGEYASEQPADIWMMLADLVQTISAQRVDESESSETTSIKQQPQQAVFLELTYPGVYRTCLRPIDDKFVTIVDRTSAKAVAELSFHRGQIVALRKATNAWRWEMLEGVEARSLKAAFKDPIPMRALSSEVNGRSAVALLSPVSLSDGAIELLETGDASAGRHPPSAAVEDHLIGPIPVPRSNIFLFALIDSLSWAVDAHEHFFTPTVGRLLAFQSNSSRHDEFFVASVLDSVASRGDPMDITDELDMSRLSAAIDSYKRDSSHFALAVESAARYLISHISGPHHRAIEISMEESGDESLHAVLYNHWARVVTDLGTTKAGRSFLLQMFEDGVRLPARHVFSEAPLVDVPDEPGADWLLKKTVWDSIRKIFVETVPGWIAYRMLRGNESEAVHEVAAFLLRNKIPVVTGVLELGTGGMRLNASGLSIGQLGALRRQVVLEVVHGASKWEGTNGVTLRQLREVTFSSMPGAYRFFTQTVVAADAVVRAVNLSIAMCRYFGAGPRDAPRSAWLSLKATADVGEVLLRLLGTSAGGKLVGSTLSVVGSAISFADQVGEGKLGGSAYYAASFAGGAMMLAYQSGLGFAFIAGPVGWIIVGVVAAGGLALALLSGTENDYKVFAQTSCFAKSPKADMNIVRRWAIFKTSHDATPAEDRRRLQCLLSSFTVRRTVRRDLLDLVSLGLFRDPFGRRVLEIVPDNPRALGPGAFYRIRCEHRYWVRASPDERFRQRFYTCAFDVVVHEGRVRVLPHQPRKQYRGRMQLPYDRLEVFRDPYEGHVSRLVIPCLPSKLDDAPSSAAGASGMFSLFTGDWEAAEPQLQIEESDDHTTQRFIINLMYGDGAYYHPDGSALILDLSRATEVSSLSLSRDHGAP